MAKALSNEERCIQEIKECTALFYDRFKKNKNGFFVVKNQELITLVLGHIDIVKKYRTEDLDLDTIRSHLFSFKDCYWG